MYRSPVPQPTRWAISLLSLVFMGVSGALLGCAPAPQERSSSSPKPGWPENVPPSERGLLPREIQKVFSANSEEFGSCWDRHGVSGPPVTAQVIFNVAPDGHPGTVSLAEASSLPALDDCLKTVTESLTFPQVGKPSSVTYPFVFRTKS
jgi:hypothetical protein